ncbi:hypothetical protein G4Z16_31985 [Streptomyces bathyalis]|uniref:Uncharacterized protein n=1 Tax=Streptomyces bathyalis TaxID=2710756 RepID=A0A7T1TCC2_9ACTN|nr:hypothetical protein [Streptomyces bathyalis]QPP10280.1 hypothetical protein G4Z16_31985 [Streptomyces bathyalis]
MVALLIGAVGFLVHYMIKTPASPYQVAFSTVGEACSKDPDSGIKGLVLDRKSGELLYCGLVPGIGGSPAGSGGKFTGAETARVIGLAKSLAAKDGVSGEDEDAVERLAADIGRGHGFEPPSLAERVTAAAGPYGLGTGLVLLIGLGLWGHYTQEQ